MRSPVIGLAVVAAVALTGCGGSTKTVTQVAAAVTTAPAPTTVVSTVTAPSPAPKKKPKHHAAPAPAPAAAPTTTTTAAAPPPAPAGPTVPGGLVNHSLPAVENKLDGDAIGYKTVGGGAFGIVLKGDWGVCATQPASGQPVHGAVKLIVGHFTCGA